LMKQLKTFLVWFQWQLMLCTIIWHLTLIIHFLHYCQLFSYGPHNMVLCMKISDVERTRARVVN
jgi:hypothetical protein